MLVKDSIIHVNRNHVMKIIFIGIVIILVLKLRWSLLGIAQDIVEEHQHQGLNAIYQDRTGRWVNGIADQESFPRKAEIKCRENTKFRIPNIIHHVWFGNREFLFHQYLSLRSAALIQRPDEVRFYIDEAEPTGPLWTEYKSEVPCLKIIKMRRPTDIYGIAINLVQHQSDVARLQILLRHGGIYLDNDAVVVQPFDSLMDKSCVLGLEFSNAFGNSIILGEPGAAFLQKWYDGYKDFDDSKYMEQSAYMPFRLHDKHPDVTLHVEEKSFLRPSYIDGMEWMEEKNYDISKNYCVHLFARKMKKTTLNKGVKELQRLNATYGSLARISLYGKPDLIEM